MVVFVIAVTVVVPHTYCLEDGWTVVVVMVSKTCVRTTTSMSMVDTNSTAVADTTIVIAAIPKVAAAVAVVPLASLDDWLVETLCWASSSSSHYSYYSWNDVAVVDLSDHDSFCWAYWPDPIPS